MRNFELRRLMLPWSVLVMVGLVVLLGSSPTMAIEGVVEDNKPTVSATEAREDIVNPPKDPDDRTSLPSGQESALGGSALNSETYCSRFHHDAEARPGLRRLQLLEWFLSSNARRVLGGAGLHNAWG